MSERPPLLERTARAARGVPESAAAGERRAPVQDPTPGRIGICCSGGGIRSAAYNLGALQVLQSEGILARARYLAAVSGGSYIAAAFSIVQKAAPAVTPSPPTFDDLPPYAPGSPEERWLRNHSSYMAPGVKGKLGLATRLALGVLLNLLLLAALVTLIAVPLGFLGGLLHPQLLGEGAAGGPAGFLRGAAAGIGAAALAALLLGLYAVGSRMDDEREARVMRRANVLWGAAAGALTVVFALPWLVGALAALLQSVRNGGAVDPATITGLLAGVGVPAVVLSAVNLVMSNGATVLARVRRWLLSPRVVAAVIAPLLLAAGFLYAYHAGATGTWPTTAIVWAGALVLLCVLYVKLDPTSASLHPLYKRRLSSAFAVYRDGEETVRERPYKDLVRLSDSEVGTEDRRWPQLLVCAAANISDAGATPPGRNAAPFVFSHDRIGGDLVGEADTTELEKALANGGRDITLPAAVAMSGAAVAPSMGKMSSKAHTFLLALANARLGVWLPNPRYVADGREAWGPLRLTWLLREMVGWNRLDGRYLYVTDGGHYENLGLLELLRRGCTEIFCFDASGDQGSAATVGQSLALARSELQVEIDLDPRELASDVNADGTAFVAATITYPKTGEHDRAVTGTLYFAKATVPSNAPWDILSHREGDPAFPHNSTADQLYTDERFEAYRALGRWSAQQVCKKAEKGEASTTFAPAA